MRDAGASALEHEKRIHRILEFLDAHLGEPLTLRRVAREAHFSEFHFHRIFRAHVGETLGSYLTRRRVELGAARLSAQPRLSILAVALDVGFMSPEAFARAFRRRYGCAPSHWKRAGRALPDRGSKVGQVKSRGRQARRPRVRHDRRMNQKPASPVKIQVLDRPAVRLCYLRYQGPFGPALGDFWSRVVAPWMETHGLLGLPRYGISRDDPATTAPEKCRYDAGVPVAADYVPPQGALLTTLPAGIHAVAEFFGRSEVMPQAWNHLLSEWLPASGYQLGPTPCFEYYPADAIHDRKTGSFSCQLCLPLQKL